MADLNAIAQRYLDTWNESDADNRAKAVGDLFTADARYIDPLSSVSGHDSLSSVIQAAQEQWAGHHFELAGTVDAHHNIARFNWHLVTEAGGDAAVIGFVTLVTTEDGNIEGAYSFVDKVAGM